MFFPETKVMYYSIALMLRHFLFCYNFIMLLEITLKIGKILSLQWNFAGFSYLNQFKNQNWLILKSTKSILTEYSPHDIIHCWGHTTLHILCSHKTSLCFSIGGKIVNMKLLHFLFMKKTRMKMLSVSKAAQWMTIFNDL